VDSHSQYEAVLDELLVSAGAWLDRVEGLTGVACGRLACCTTCAALQQCQEKIREQTVVGVHSVCF
jgi:hypothetical protein